ncbi:MAG: copper amine oxidase N-terminal domain-containing protein [Firmicutes bacterium]|nr:copper amine oxidase N-terminal domain-containing protein [Bacillota bacterium]
MKKHSVIFLTALAAAALSCNVFAQTKTVNMRIGDSQMTVNGEVSELDSPPVIIDSRTLVPIRAIVEALDGKVQWYGETKTAVLQNKDGKTVTLTINSTEALQTGEKVQLDTPPVIINGRTMLPIRFVAESFGYKTDWNADDKSIVISDGEISETETKPETKAFDLTGYEENFIARDASGKEYYMMYRESEDVEPVAYFKIKDKNGKDIAVYKEMDVWGTVYADKSGKNITIAYNSEDESYTIVTNGTEKKAAIGDSYLPTDEDGNTYENPDSDDLVVKDKSGKVVGEYTATGESWVYYVDEEGSKVYTLTARDGGYKDGFVSSD